VLDLDASPEVRRARYFNDRPSASAQDFLQWHEGLERSKWSVEQDVRAGILDEHGIICFSKSHSNLLLWSHYAKDHTGFCLGFDEEALRELPSLAAHGSVKYYADAPVFRCFQDPPEKFVSDVIFHKSLCWSYEEEYRFVLQRQGKVEFRSDALKEVILGCRAHHELRMLVRSKMRTSGIGFYQMAEIPTRFNIIREPIQADVFSMASHF
jgi:hypothetical protein